MPRIRRQLASRGTPLAQIHAVFRAPRALRQRGSAPVGARGWPSWRRILGIGAPAGGEFVMMFVIFSFIYWVIRPFGAPAQAGFASGTRVMQAIFLPAMAVAFSVAPIVGQNFGAHRFERVRATRLVRGVDERPADAAGDVRGAVARPGADTRLHRGPSRSVQVGADYLKFISWNFLCSGFIFTCSGALQGLGNTWPSLWASLSRVATFIAPVVWLSAQPHFALNPGLESSRSPR